MQSIVLENNSAIDVFFDIIRNYVASDYVSSTKFATESICDAYI